MAVYSDVTYFLAYIVGLIGEIVTAIGTAFLDSVIEPGEMYKLTQGIFGDNGGWIYWVNGENLWKINEYLSGLTFTFP